MFEEVRPWSDSLAMVKINYNWIVYDLCSIQFIVNGIKDYSLIKNEPSERIAIIYKDNRYGVVSSKRGIIISPTFTEIVNLGTAEKPLYFTEKHVEEAEVFIVIYYDSEWNNEEASYLRNRGIRSYLLPIDNNLMFADRKI